MKNAKTQALCHHGIRGQKWGERHGPPYPLDKAVSRQVRINRINDGKFVRYNASNSPEIASQPGPEKLQNLQRKTEIFSAEEDARQVNNIYGRGRIGRVFNCQNCSAAVEMRARGYDVAARMRDDGSNAFTPEKWFKDGEFKMVDTDDLVDAYADYIKTKRGGRYDYVEYGKTCFAAYGRFMSELQGQPAGARGIVTVGWCRNAEDLSKRTSEFHAFNYRVNDDGVTFIDAEGKRDWILSDKEYAHNGTPKWVDPREWAYMRTDNLELNQSITEAVISRRLVDK